MPLDYYELQRLPLRAFFSMLVRLRISGVERMPRTGGVVVVCNHLTYLDPLILGVAFGRPMHFMAKAELFRSKPLALWLTCSGAFAVRREGLDRSALKVAEGYLRAGQVVMIFPEGHRSASAQLQAARSGAVLLAARAGVPVLPVAIMGTEQLFRPGDWRAVLGRPVVRVRVGDPVPCGDAIGPRRRKEAADQVMREIVALLPPAYHGVYTAEGVTT